MKKSLDSLIVSSVLCILLLMSAASFADCQYDDRGRAEIGHALGVLIYENIVKDYASQVSIEDIAAGLKHADSAEGFELLPETVDLSPGSMSDRKMSVTAAQNIIDNWRAAPESVGERFVSSYKKLSETSEERSGLLWRRVDQQSFQDRDTETSANAGFDKFERCMDKGAEADAGKYVCFAQLEISENAVCDATEAMVDHLEKSTTAIGYGQFQSDEVIAGWTEAFGILEKLAEASTRQGTSENDRSQHKYNYLEVVVPPQLAYGAKGLPGKVDSNETLWFVMAVK
ncbi:MAG: FKBP-type peptidyl-prolyl cis-trans isomerase [Granulosicoccus sp.]